MNMMMTLMVICRCALEVNRLIRLSEIPDVNKQKNAPANQCGFVSPSRKGT